jgi:dihydrofolate reductase
MRLIVACDRKRGMAKRGFQPWYIPEDEKYFTDQTKSLGGIVLVGNTTFKTFHGPLAGRENYILTRHDTMIKGVHVVHDLATFLEDFKDKDVWVVGGAAVFDQVMQAGNADILYITHIDADFGCDQFFPDYDNGFTLAEQTETREQNGFTFTYAKYVNKTT